MTSTAVHLGSSPLGDLGDSSRPGYYFSDNDGQGAVMQRVVKIMFRGIGPETDVLSSPQVASATINAAFPQA
jgi:hypothetical protein